MDEFDGPSFSPDLVGPDGRLTRFCKGRRRKLLKAQLAETQRANNIAAAAQRQNAALAAERQSLERQMLELQAQNSQSANTIYEDDRDSKRAAGRRRRRSSAFGIRSTMSGLGGSPTQLG